MILIIVDGQINGTSPKESMLDADLEILTVLTLDTAIDDSFYKIEVGSCRLTRALTTEEISNVQTNAGPQT